MYNDLLEELDIDEEIKVLLFVEDWDLVLCEVEAKLEFAMRLTFEAENSAARQAFTKTIS